MLHALSTVVLALVAAGLLVRRRPALHLRLMIAAFVVDLSLVLYIEATRHAVETVAATSSAFILFHATVSLLVLAAYVTQFALGRRVLAGIHTARRTHVRSFRDLRG